MLTTLLTILLTLSGVGYGNVTQDNQPKQERSGTLMSDKASNDGVTLGG